MDKRNTQSGFGAIEIIFIVLVVALLGYLGWRLYDAQTHKSTPAATQQTQKSNTTNTTAVVPEPQYVSNDFKYSFTYPSTWKTSDAMNASATAGQPKPYSLTIESPDFKITEEGIGPIATSGARMWVSAYKTTATTAAEAFQSSSFYSYAAKDRQDTKLDGVSAVRYKVQYESNPTLTTSAVKNGYLYDVVLDYANDDAFAKYSKDYDALISSFKFQ